MAILLCHLKIAFAEYIWKYVGQLKICEKEGYVLNADIL